MKKYSTFLAALSSLGGMASARYVMYADQYHTSTFPNTTLTEGIDHAVMAFMPASDFTSDPHGNFTLFEPLETFKARFPKHAKIIIAIGGWGDAGWHDALRNDSMVGRFAANVAVMLDKTGLDGVDIDCEYPGGNGFDYKQIPNSELTGEIEQFPKLLSAIRTTIGPGKILSIATPGLERDMIAFNKDTVPLIAQEIDYMNIMTYDLMNRRDTTTKHHTDIKGSLAAIDKYLEFGLPAKKANLGIAFYAKYFTVARNNCVNPIGCPTALLEDVNGTDTGLSGAYTFEKPVAVPAKLTVATDGTCGASVAHKCPSSIPCCSQYGFCGNTAAHCGLSCQADYGKCNGTSAAESWKLAEANGKLDAENGGQYYFDHNATLFWTWDTAELVTKKFTDIIKARGIGGIMAWSLAEDSDGWALLKAMHDGVKASGLSEIPGDDAGKKPS